MHDAKALTFLLMLVAMFQQGCATTPPGDAVELRLSLDSPSYGIGEPVQARVYVSNTCKSEVLIPALDDSTLTFYWGQPGTGVRMKRRPVLPENLPGERRTLKPGGAASRGFLFTRVTTEPGQWGLLAALSGHSMGKGGDQPLLTCYSNPVHFTVEDRVVFKRDPYSGIIMPEQALATARLHAGAPPETPGRSVLVPIGESGLYLWAVFLGGEGDGTEDAVTLQVSPYTGQVEPLNMAELQGEGSE
jgi:hypothetical protein